jgi:uncharacterized protein (TIGR00255 family)
MKSMTGFAKQQCEANGKKYTIEIKTLNSKTLDINIKAPAALRSKELELRSMLNPLERGKIEVYITEGRSDSNLGTLNTDLLVARYQQVNNLAQQLGTPAQHLLDTLLSMSDIWDTPTDTEISDDEWQPIAQAFALAVDEVQQFREHEGSVLAIDFVKHIDLIEQKLNQIPAYESQRIETAKERIRRYFTESAIKEVDSNRFEQELIYYLEKLDITEEKIRLAKHIDYFRNTMRNEEGSGKKLGFIAQEMGREINTTGSKANHVEIQKLVVEMKDELEKIKEQLGNIL